MTPSPLRWKSTESTAPYAGQDCGLVCVVPPHLHPGGKKSFLARSIKGETGKQIFNAEEEEQPTRWWLKAQLPRLASSCRARGGSSVARRHAVLEFLPPKQRPWWMRVERRRWSSWASRGGGRGGQGERGEGARRGRGLGLGRAERRRRRGRAERRRPASEVEVSFGGV